MAWIKVPAEHHPLFLEALPRDPRITTVRLFGGMASLVGGNMFGGLFARSIIVRLSPADRALALAMDGTAPFDPMGNGRVMSETLLLSEEVMEDAATMRAWLTRGFAHALTLPPKKNKAAKGKATSSKPAAPARKGKATSSKPAAPARKGKVTSSKPAAPARKGKATSSKPAAPARKATRRG
jgi:TfoX/Sxy family transcriptional regulator of competence genes